jgi:hypothetical protein
MELKKSSVGAAERDEFLRASWRAMIVAGRTEAKCFVFVDECSTNISPSSLHAHAPKGQCVARHLAASYGPGVTLLASLSVGGAGPCLEVEEVLGQSLRSGQIAVMDDLSSHKGGRAGNRLKCEAARSFSICCPLAGSQSHRRGLRQAQGVVAQSSNQEPRDFWWRR